MEGIRTHQSIEQKIIQLGDSFRGLLRDDNNQWWVAYLFDGYHQRKTARYGTAREALDVAIAAVDS